MVMSLSLFTACSGGNEDQQGDAQQGETSTVIKQKEYNYLTGMPFADSPFGFIIIVAASLVLGLLVTIFFMKNKLFK